MKSIFVFLFFTISISSYSQSFEWAVDANDEYIVSTIIAGFSVATDASNNVYVTGYFDNLGVPIDMDPGLGEAFVSDNGAVDVFVLKLDSDHNFQWVKTMGGIGNDRAYGITVDASGNVYTCGEFQSSVDFDPSSDVFTLTATGANPDLFIQKLDTDGNFIWAKKFGNAEIEEFYNVTVDNSGNVIATGSFRSSVDFDPGAGTTILTSAGLSDAFVLKLNADGNLIWAKDIRNTSNSLATGVDTDSEENVYITGSFQGLIDFDPSPDSDFNVSAVFSYDAFLLKLNSDGEFVWAKSCGSSSHDYGNALTVSGMDNVYVAGTFRKTVDFDPNEGEEERTSSGISDVFLQKFDSDGNLTWVNTVGTASQEDVGYKIAVDENEYATIVSYVSSGDYKMTITNYFGNGDKRWFVEVEDVPFGFSITTDTEGAIYTAGVIYAGTIDFNPFAGTSFLHTHSSDYFLLKLGSEPNAIDELRETVSLRVYPNPSQGSFTIKLPNEVQSADIRIVNIAGATIQENTLDQTETEMNLDLESGIYYIVMTLNSGKVLTEKIIIN